jgi:nitrogenase molybdenum-iron protein beta chain
MPRATEQALLASPAAGQQAAGPQAVAQAAGQDAAAPQTPQAPPAAGQQAGWRTAAESIYAQRSKLPLFVAANADVEQIDSPLIEYPRYSCALGAQQSVVAIPRALPILHSGPGCSTKVQALIGQGEGYGGGSTIPCTNSGEAEVIYGGANKLRGVIEGAFKVIDADLFVVLTGCTSDIVGDDIASIVGDFQLEGRPIVYVETGGFKSNNYASHAAVVNAIIDQYVDLNKESGGVKRGLVNVFASIPYQDPFWNGNLEELKRILTGIGLEVNILFGQGCEGMAEWHRIPRAQFNIVADAWAGLGIAKHLQERYGTPWLHYDHFPIGARDSSDFLRQVVDIAGFSAEQRLNAEKFIAAEERRFYAHFDTLMDFLLEFRYGLPRRFHSLLDASYALGLSRFLLNEAGVAPARQFVLDDTPPQYQESLRASFRKASHLARREVEVSFITDAGLAHEAIRGAQGDSRLLLIGSSWERQLAADLNADLLIVSVPVVYRIVLSACYIGYNGGLRLVEDLYSQVLAVFR